MLEITKPTTCDEMLSRKTRYFSFWREVFSTAETHKASDIHVHSLRSGLLVRIRVDGVLKEVQNVKDPDYALELVVTLKQIAGLDTSTRRVMQDGSFSLKNTKATYRISLSPGYGYGEGMVLRVIREDEIPELSSLGLSNQAQKDLSWAAEQNQGLFLVTGPTGSGKSTTLQASLMHLNRAEQSVITVEDPVERILPDVWHQQTTPVFGWKQAIKCAMRSDPEVILVGEIRDEESAELAVEAAQTGHLVMSTLHTNSVVDTVDRLFTLGIKPHQIADNLLFVSAQRLLSRLCSHCKIAKGEHFTRNKLGCEHCNLGFKGRVPILEYALCIKPEDIISGDKKALKKQLQQTLISELEMEVKKGSVCSEVLENSHKKGFF